METPHLPPKPTVARSEVDVVPVDLPVNCHLLAADELRSLFRDHRDKLEEYVMRFNDIGDVKETIAGYKNDFMKLCEQFESLTTKRHTVEDELEEYKALEHEYLSKAQELETMMNERLGDKALRNRLRLQIRELDDKSRALEADHSLDIDSFITQHLELRTQYHLRREKLETWELQDGLKK